MSSRINTPFISSKHAKVFITSAYPDPEPVTAFRTYASLDRIKAHTQVFTPEEADIILFIENSHYLDDFLFTKLLNHELVQKYPGKVYMYNPHDRPWYLLPGLYMCMPKYRFDGRHMSAGAYLETINPYIRCDFSREPELLFSFYGATSSPPRYKIAELTHPRASIIISNQPMYVANKPKNLQLHYADLLCNSKFILCPKGSGPSSVRLFETLQAGRVPVIISDDLVLPEGPDWHQFAVFVPENRLQHIPAILEQEEASWPEKARRSREAWEQFFAPDTIFNYFINCLLALPKTPDLPLPLRVRHLSVRYYYKFRKTVVRRIKETLALQPKISQ